jgi:hypothetical protein
MRQHVIALTMIAILAACTPAGTPAPAGSQTPQISEGPAVTVDASPTKQSQPDPTKKSKGRNPSAAPTSTNPDFIATEILGRPTDSSVTVNVVPAIAMEIYYEVGTASGKYTSKTAVQTAAAGAPIETLMDGLQPNTRYHYRINYNGTAGVEHTFVTQRAMGSTFTFAVQADSHLNTDKHCNPDLYRLTMLNMGASQPDFLVDLGDTFRTDMLKDINPTTILKNYVDQRQYFGMVSSSAPLFLINGNHEMEWGWLLDGEAENPAVWSANARNLYYPQPAPDDYYSGDLLPIDNIGLLRDYYAWTWGDALFVVIDPYWSTTTDPKKSRDNWDWTLGEKQYQWFRQTLETSETKYKFVFTHHILGENRGGVEDAPYFEWGGQNRDGSWGFDVNRPGWDMPIHQLMAENLVTIFFQGHDHLFARQELDGVIYQTVPMPADSTYQTPNQEVYISGITRPESGYLRVTVSPQRVTVDYIRSFLSQDENASQQNGMVDYTYTITNP